MGEEEGGGREDNNNIETTLRTAKWERELFGLHVLWTINGKVFQNEVDA